MGNCLVLDSKELIKIKQSDRDILKYHSPVEVHQALSNFHANATFDKLLAARHLKTVAGIQSGHLNDLLRPKKMQTKETGAVRIKLVISKQELKEILEKEGLTLEDMMTQIQKDPTNSQSREKERSVMWKPALESISEVC